MNTSTKKTLRVALIGNKPKPLLGDDFLGIKYLASYLPYNLKIKYRDYTGILLRVWQDGLNLHVNCKNGIGTFINSKYPREFYPILKPISDLERLIQNEFSKLDDFNASDYTSEIIELFCFENIGFEEELSAYDLSKLPYECVEFMFKNHYDFFGLIDKGLAVSIHDVGEVIA